MSKKAGGLWLDSSGLLFEFYCLNVTLEKLVLVHDKDPFF